MDPTIREPPHPTSTERILFGLAIISVSVLSFVVANLVEIPPAPCSPAGGQTAPGVSVLCIVLDPDLFLAVASIPLGLGGVWIVVRELWVLASSERSRKPS